MMKVRAKALWVFLLLVLPCQQALAEINFLDLKGTEEFLSLRHECDFLSPEIPLGLLKQGRLNNDYHYGSDDDPVVGLVRKSFNSVSENPAFFQITPLAEHVAGLLPPAVIGKLLGVFSEAHRSGQVPDADRIKELIESDPSFQRKLDEIDRLKKQAEAELDQYQEKSETHQRLKDLEDRKSDYDSKFEAEKKIQKSKAQEALKACGKDRVKRNQILDEIDRNITEILTKEYPKLISSISHYDQEAKELTEEIKKDEQVKNLKKVVRKYNYKEKYLDEFIHDLLVAFESNEHPESIYPRGYVEQILLSMGWMNGEKKEDILSLYQHLPQQCFTRPKIEIFPDNLANQKRREAWLSAQYNYQNLANHLTNPLMDKNLSPRRELKITPNILSNIQQI